MPPSLKKVFALVDCNNFYASCERLFRPELIGKPVVVLSNNDGCIVARSNEAKALGIPMGAPLFKMKYLIAKHGVHVFSSNYALYLGFAPGKLIHLLKPRRGGAFSGTCKFGVCLQNQAVSVS